VWSSNYRPSTEHTHGTHVQAQLKMYKEQNVFPFIQAKVLIAQLLIIYTHITSIVTEMLM